MGPGEKAIEAGKPRNNRARLAGRRREGYTRIKPGGAYRDAATTVTFTSPVTWSCPSLAMARKTYAPGALNRAVDDGLMDGW